MNGANNPAWRDEFLHGGGAARIYAAPMSRDLIYIYGGRRDCARREDRELVPFSPAVSHVYTQLTGASLSPYGSPLFDALMSEVAQAIANLVTIYGAPSDEVPVKPLTEAEVKHGAFQRAATVIRTSDGIEYRRLYIRRGDVRAAAAVLKKSGARFDSAGEAAAAFESAEVPHKAASELGMPS